MNYCYLLYNDNNTTYVGATKDVDKRLRQHNGELVGGARATSIQVHKGFVWRRACYISNIPDWRSALQIEWRWKQIGRTQFKHIRDPLERRLWALKMLLSLDKPTSSAVPYAEYENGLPLIIWESDELQAKYENIQLR